MDLHSSNHVVQGQLAVFLPNKTPLPSSLLPSAQSHSLHLADPHGRAQICAVASKPGTFHPNKGPSKRIPNSVKGNKTSKSYMWKQLKTFPNKQERPRQHAKAH